MRSHDAALTDLGQHQAECLAEFLPRANPSLTAAAEDTQNRAGFGLTHIYCSQMARAVATGMVMAARLSLPLRAWLDWHEEGACAWGDGLTTSNHVEAILAGAVIRENFDGRPTANFQGTSPSIGTGSAPTTAAPPGRSSGGSTTPGRLAADTSRGSGCGREITTWMHNSA